MASPAPVNNCSTNSKNCIGQFSTSKPATVVRQTKLVYDSAPLQLARAREGFTYSRLAERTGLTRSLVYSTLTGRTRAVATVAAIARVLDVDINECWHVEPCEVKR